MLQAIIITAAIGWSQEAIRQFSPEEAKAYPHVLELYVRTRCLFDTLTQIEYMESKRLYPWMKFGPRIQVKEFSYNHLTQTIHIQDQSPTL